MSPFDQDPPPPGQPFEPNPYAAPEAELFPRDTSYVLPGRAFAVPFSIDTVLRHTWDLYKRQMGVTMAVALGAFGINMGYAFATNLAVVFITRSSGQNAANLAQIPLTIVGYVINFWLLGGQTLALLKLARGQEADFGDLFRGGRYFWRMFGATILFLLALLPPFALGGLVVGVAFGLSRGQPGGAAIAALVVGVVAGVIVMVAVAMRLYQYPYALVDHDCGPIEALRISAEITRGHVIELVGVSMLIGLIGGLGFLALCVGWLFTFPFSMLAMACVYDSLAAQAGIGPAKPPRADLEFLDS